MTTIHICDRHHSAGEGMVRADYTTSRHDSSPPTTKDLCEQHAREEIDNFFQAGVNATPINLKPIRHAYNPAR